MLGNFKTIKIMKLAVTHIFENKQFNCTFLSVTSPVWQQAHNNCSKRPCTRLLALKLNYLPVAYSLSNNYTKNYRNRATAIEIIVEGCVAYFFAIQCISRRYLKKTIPAYSATSTVTSPLLRDTFMIATFDAVRIARGAESMWRSGVRPSFCPSVCPVNQQQQPRAVGLLLSAPRAPRTKNLAMSAAGARAQQQMRVVSCWEPADKVQHRLVFYRSTWIARIDRLNRLTRSIRNARWHWIDGTCRSDMKKMLLRFFCFRHVFMHWQSKKFWTCILKTLVEIEQNFKWYLTSFAALPNSLFLLITLSKSTGNASW